MSLTAERQSVTVADLVETLNSQRQNPGLRQPAPRVDAAKSLPSSVLPILVLGAHPGAGASTVALALADLATPPPGAAGAVHLIDAASREHSGLLCAAEHELGRDGDWLVGRRGPIVLYRPAVPLASAGDIPSLPLPNGGVLVIDAGWPHRELLRSPTPLTSLLPRCQVVLVCRASIPGVRRAQLAIADLPDSPLVVGVGASRWPGPVRATFGHKLCEAVDAGRGVVVPTSRRLEVHGIGPEPLPRAATGAVAPLVADVLPAPSVACRRRRSR